MKQEIEDVVPDDGGSGVNSLREVVASMFEVDRACSQEGRTAVSREQGQTES